MPRKIIHIDMDAFFAAVEQRDFPELRGKPVVVGGSPSGRGVVATASYEARPFGVHSAMPAAQARRLCPQAIFVRPRFEVYRQVSRTVQALLADYSELIEPLSLDEAYIDVTHCERQHNSATLIARQMRQQILESTGLSASAGISYNKLLAKLASDINKPNGQFVITPEQGPAFVEQLPIGRFHGIGKATEAKMLDLGIATGADLKTWRLEQLQHAFGKLGDYYYSIARAIDDREVQSQRQCKSISSETTFDTDLDDWSLMLQHLEGLAGDVATQLEARQLRGHTLTIKVKYADFQLVSRSHTASVPLRHVAQMRPWLGELLQRTEAGARKVRLLGVGVSNFVVRGQRTAIQRTLEID